MLHTVGDSHCKAVFKGVNPHEDHWIGPVTMERIGNPQDRSLPTIGKRGDHVVYSFGEIDVRYHIVKRAAALKISIDEMITARLCARYIERLKNHAARSPGVEHIVMAVVPPIYMERHVNAMGSIWKIESSNELRRDITNKLNIALRLDATAAGIEFFDVYAMFCDDQGMLDPALGDCSGHVTDTHAVQQYALEHHWI